MVENLTWKDIIESDIDQLQEYCKEFGLPIRGDEGNLKERLLRHVLNISLPSGELFLEGKVNINTAAPEEMEMWPFMGETLIKNIMDYRDKYGKFYEIEEILNVKGVGPKIFQKLVQFVDISGKTHIRIKREPRVEADMELIKLEDDIRNKAWELKDLKDHLDLDIEYLAEYMRGLENKEKSLTITLKEVETFQSRLKVREREFNELRASLAEHYKYIQETEKKKEKEYREVKKEREALKVEKTTLRSEKEKLLEIEREMEKILPREYIFESDIEKLKAYCEDLGLPIRGDKGSLKERLLRHFLNISLPSGELFLEGKLNLNTATPEEMGIWPYMGETLIKNIMDYRDKYGKFYKVEDLLNVKGIGPNLFKRLVPYADVSGRTHIKIKRRARVDADMALIKLEDDIRNKAWELQDLKDHINLDIESLGGLMKGIEKEKELIGMNLSEVGEFRSRLEDKGKELEELIANLTDQFEYLKNMEETMRNVEDEKQKLKEKEISLENEKESLHNVYGLIVAGKKKIDDDWEVLETGKKKMRYLIRKQEAAIEFLEIAEKEKKRLKDMKERVEEKGFKVGKALDAVLLGKEKVEEDEKAVMAQKEALVSYVELKREKEIETVEKIRRHIIILEEKRKHLEKAKTKILEARETLKGNKEEIMKLHMEMSQTVRQYDALLKEIKQDKKRLARAREKIMEGLERIKLEYAEKVRDAEDRYRVLEMERAALQDHKKRVRDLILKGKEKIDIEKKALLYEKKRLKRAKDKMLEGKEKILEGKEKIREAVIAKQRFDERYGALKADEERLAKSEQELKRELRKLQRERDKFEREHALKMEAYAENDADIEAEFRALEEMRGLIRKQREEFVKDRLQFLKESMYYDCPVCGGTIPVKSSKRPLRVWCP
ncbi:MAG: helix-hairpin-helix domain-containing protein [Thermoplasmata archaeon]|nr:helix-hairpin-helix domain-containing protein [Thermoplasmata archaeon]